MEKADPCMFMFVLEDTVCVMEGKPTIGSSEPVNRLRSGGKA